MNDQFLYELRRPPPARFARRLKRQLDQQASRPARRFSWSRTLLTLFLIGGSALAGAYLAMNSRSGVDNDEPAKSPAATEQRVVRNSFQTSGSATTAATVEAAAGVGEDSSAHRDESHANAQSSTTHSSTSPSDTQAYGGAILGGSATISSGGPKEPSGPRLMIVTSYLAHSLTRGVVDTYLRDMRVKPAVDIRTEDAAAAFRTLCRKAAQPIDVIVASRAMTDAEREQCRREDAPELLEFKIGYQAVVLARGTTSAPIKLSARSMYLALAQQIPDSAEPAQLIDNPNRTWDQIEPRVDARPIAVLGPVPGTPLRRAVEVIVLGAECDTYPGIQALQESDPERYAEICYSVRADGLYQEVGQTVTMVSQNLAADPHAIAIVDYNFYRGQRAQFTGSVLAGVEPTDATLADGTYPLARPVYVYAYAHRARVDRVSLGSKLFWEFVERASWQRGGFTPVSEQEREAQYERQQIPTRGSWTGP